MKCGKEGCSCERAEGRHGPYFSLTRAVGGKTTSRYLTGQQAELARQQIQAGQELRKQIEDCWDACEAWADSELEGAGTARTAQKGGLEEAFDTEVVAEIEALVGQGAAEGLLAAFPWGTHEWGSAPPRPG